MKTLTIYCALTLLVLLVALLCGCQNQGPFDPSIRGGVNEVGQPRSAAIRAPIVTIPFVPVVPEVDLGVYQMPPPKDGVVAVAADSQYIIAAIGGTLSCVDSYVDYNGQLVTRAATLTIPPLALRNDGMISMSLNPTELAVDFAPEGLVFRHQIGLDFSVTGISELKSGAPVNFYYVNYTNNQLLPVSYDSLTVDTMLGNVNVYNASILHFSRYGFAR